jgi:tRNA(fMet)-specific endonuclease VapC
MICLDTNVVMTIFNKPASRAEARLRAEFKVGNAVAISSLVLFELWHGAAKSARTERNKNRIEDFLVAPIAILQFDAEDAREAGEIRAALERSGTPIGPYDILIAAQARRRDALLVTANEREFARVPGLKTEDWAS